MGCEMENNGIQRKKSNAFKRFIGNKNTVTILAILVCIATLIIGYNIRVSKAISPISVPYAKVNIPSRTLITDKMIGKVKISASYVNSATDLIKSTTGVINKYATYRTDIPAGSLFYKSLIMEPEEMPDYAFSNIQDGYTIFSLGVNVDSTYANSIRANDFIDLYMSAYESDTGNVIFAKFIESIRVLAVKDGQGNNIIGNSLDYGTPAELLFAVPDDMYELLMASQYVSKKITLTPVLRNANYSTNGKETQVSSEYLRSIIEDQVLKI